MQRRLSYVLLGLTLLYLLLTNFTNLRSFRSIPESDLLSRDQQLSLEIDTIKERAVAAPKDSPEKRALYRLITERGKVLTELALRHYYIDQLATVLLIMLLFLMVANRLKSRQQTLPGSKAQAIRDMNVFIENPREEYIDEWELRRRIEGGFRSKEEATQWLKNDPMLKCEYCGGQLRSTFTGDRESVQLITFYKNVPEGAKDLRVVLGTYWFPKHANELRCSQCGKTVQR